MVQILGCDGRTEDGLRILQICLDLVIDNSHHIPRLEMYELVR